MIPKTRVFLRISLLPVVFLCYPPFFIFSPVRPPKKPGFSLVFSITHRFSLLRAIFNFRFPSTKRTPPPDRSRVSIPYYLIIIERPEASEGIHKL